ncbi:hypothetical protein RhiirA4_476328 [Rhizophagus irregularis]|uniref:Uncharacterized protein n=1 Tax=Rhizophagus irregularis TaxID=588596 RepID=A0A2I1HBE6_9GLOM|nr:hypothetical protein RhiirA4_476328 [Rhizophagus irregularis]
MRTTPPPIVNTGHVAALPPQFAHLIHSNLNSTQRATLRHLQTVIGRSVQQQQQPIERPNTKRDRTPHISGQNMSDNLNIDLPRSKRTSILPISGHDNIVSSNKLHDNHTNVLNLGIDTVDNRSTPPPDPDQPINISPPRPIARPRTRKNYVPPTPKRDFNSFT